MASLSDQKMKEIEAEMNRFEEEISGTGSGGKGFPPPPPPPNPVIIGAHTFQAVQKKIAHADAPGAPEKTAAAPLAPPPPPPPIGMGANKPPGLAPPPPPPAPPAFMPPQLRHRHPPPPPRPPPGLVPPRPGMPPRMPPPRPPFMGRPPGGPPSGPPMGGSGPPMGGSGPPRMGGPPGPSHHGGPMGGPPNRPPMGGMPPMGGGPPMGGPPMGPHGGPMGGPPPHMGGPPAMMSDQEPPEKKEKMEPGVMIAKKGVTYTPAKTQEEIEQEEMEAKFLAMEKEIKAEKKAKKKAATINEGDFTSGPMDGQSEAGTSNPAIVVPEIDVEAFVAKFQREKAKSEKAKKKKFLRTAAGETWEDTSLEEWDPDDFRVFCGDLGNEVTDEVLARAFSRYPTFQRAKVVRDKRTNKTRGFGFVSFKDPNDFMKAIREMNGKYVGNRPIKLRKSTWKDRQFDIAKKREKEKKKLGYR